MKTYWDLAETALKYGFAASEKEWTLEETISEFKKIFEEVFGKPE